MMVDLFPTTIDEYLNEGPSDDTSWMLIGVTRNGDCVVLDAAQGFFDKDMLPNGLDCDDNGVGVDLTGILRDEFSGYEAGAYRSDRVDIVATRDWETGQVDGCDINVSKLVPYTALGKV